MPMTNRRPNLASLVVPAPSPSLSEDIRTPLPHTPLVTSPIVTAPMVMTPDTPCFTIPSIEATLAGAEQKRIAWSETQDDLIQSYLSHPPRPLKNAYPPDSLPPPVAIEEIALQLLLHPQWPASHGLVATRARVLELARKNVTEYHQGPKREYVPIMPAAAATAAGRAGSALAMGPALAKRAMRPKLTVGAAGPGSLGMNRQADSMDSLYGDAEPGTFSEALRLSSTLQDTAATGANELSSVGALSSPLEFTFTFNPPQTSALPVQNPFAHGVRAPRPASLLQRGRSFTGDDLAGMPSMMEAAAIVGNVVEDEREGLDVSGALNGNGRDIDVKSGFRDAPETNDELIRQPSSPVSSFSVSPPSSITSSIEDEEMPTLLSLPPSMTSSTSSIATITTTTTTTLIQGFGNLDVEPEPLTPLNQTFFSLNTPVNPRSAITPSTRPTACAAGLSTPAITLTVDSPCAADTPRLAGDHTAMDHDGDTKMASPSAIATAQAFAKLSLNPRARQPPPAPMVRRARPGANSAGLSRSLSEGMVSPLPHAFPIARLAQLNADAAQDMPAGHGLARPMNKRQRSNTPDLSVFVPRPGGRNWVDELKSPFEHKPAGSGAAQGLST